MYFSLIMPAAGLERDAAHQWASSSYAEHQWLWRFFPAPAGTPRGFIFRRRDVNGIPEFYVVSKRRPVRQSVAWDVQTRDYAPSLELGARLRFDLRANPVVTHSRDGKHGRHDVVMQEKKRLLEKRGLARWRDWQDNDKPALFELVRDCCGAWLRARASRLGFEVDEESLAVDGYQRHAGEHGQLAFTTADFSGELTVTDSLAFANTLRNGVGPAKAFGCGLLLVRRL